MGEILLAGDIDCDIEILQNIFEDAIKYGDGCIIKIDFSEEENCKLITVKTADALLRIPNCPIF